MGGGGIASHVTYLIFLLILTFLIATNYKGFVEIMKQGGLTGVPVIKVLQGR